MSSIEQEGGSQWEFDAPKYWNFAKPDSEKRWNDSWFASRRADGPSFPKPNNIQEKEKYRSTNFHLPVYKFDMAVSNATIAKQQNQKPTPMEINYDKSNHFTVVYAENERQTSLNEQQGPNTLRDTSPKPSKLSQHEQDMQDVEERIIRKMSLEEDTNEPDMYRLSSEKNAKEDISQNNTRNINRTPRMSVDGKHRTTAISPSSLTKETVEEQQSERSATKEKITKVDVLARLMRNTVASAGKLRQNNGKPAVPTTSVSKHVVGEVNARAGNASRQRKPQMGKSTIPRASATSSVSIRKTSIPLNEKSKIIKKHSSAGHKASHLLTKSVERRPMRSIERHDNPSSHPSTAIAASRTVESAEPRAANAENRLAVSQHDVRQISEKSLSNLDKNDRLREAPSAPNMNVLNKDKSRLQNNDTEGIGTDRTRHPMTDWHTIEKEISESLVHADNPRLFTTSNSVQSRNRDGKSRLKSHALKLDRPFTAVSTVHNVSKQIPNKTLPQSQTIAQHSEKDDKDDNRDISSGDTRIHFDALLKRMEHIRSQLQKVVQHEVAHPLAPSRPVITASNISIEDKIKRAKDVIAESKRRSKRWYRAPKEDHPASSTAHHDGSQSKGTLLRSSNINSLDYKRTGTNAELFHRDKRKRPMVLQEWWGVNEQIKVHAQRIADNTGMHTVIPDLYKGKIGVTAEEASHLMSHLDWKEAVESLKQLANNLRQEKYTKIGAVGFCMGGALAIALSTAAAEANEPIQAAVACYGRPPADQFDVKKITNATAVQGHFGGKDTMAGFSDPAAADDLEAGLVNAKQVAIYRYPEQGHAFLNDEDWSISMRKELGFVDKDIDVKTAEQATRDLAWSRMYSFFAEHLL
ncbi:hypothetical protein EC973_001685 [Apophysomyces ossiformis]|uniref:Dienelactone hydrolase domain-containing protein n=1 Tax=Apophysomyces ossiformis TaxID=679940 RepID=A0A8H7BJA3_9FUNG|nr:hypothetical protein EC973_001685 [Apophysomyces ossiformis]